MLLPSPGLQGATFTRSAERKRGRIDVWFASTAPAREKAILQRCRTILSRQDIDRCLAFHREEDRRRALVARALVRETLSRYAPVDPVTWEFTIGAHGKPAIAAPACGLRLRFNLSHAGMLVACALSLDDEVGLDLEDTAREVDPDALAQRVFSPEEIAALRALAPESRRRRFFEGWSLKEAYLKARGLGFALAPQSASFDLGRRGRLRAHFNSEADDQPTAWWFALLGAQPGHVLALAARNGGRPASVRAFLAAPGDTQATQLAPHLYAESCASDPLP